MLLTGCDSTTKKGNQSSKENKEQIKHDDHEGHDHGPEDGHAHGEYQPDPSELPPPPDFSPEAARVIAERFGIGTTSALAMLRTAADSSRRPLRVVAHEVVVRRRTGRLRR